MYKYLNGLNSVVDWFSWRCELTKEVGSSLFSRLTCQEAVQPVSKRGLVQAQARGYGTHIYPKYFSLFFVSKLSTMTNT